MSLLLALCRGGKFIPSLELMDMRRVAHIERGLELSEG
jgi:hypothetical protein